MDELKKIIVIGASAGGFKAIKDLVSGIPPHLPAAIFVVMHLSKTSSADVIRDMLDKHTYYTCSIPDDGEAIKAGNIYIAKPDYHLLVKKDKIRLINGPHENRWRPSIDVLFRSAAAAFDSRVIGIILSGMLDDGTAGMSAIKRSGGKCIVQEPAEAEFSDMPINVLNTVDVDYRASVNDIGYILDDIFSQPAQDIPIPEDVKLEAEITERMISSIEDLQKISTHSNYTCPDCGGGLWLMKNEKAPRYRCHTGHVYTEKILLEKQTEELEESLWVSIRMLEERKNLMLRMAARNETAADVKSYEEQQVMELDKHIERLKGLLVEINKHGDPAQSYN